MKKDYQDIVLSARQDDFYRRYMYANFGDLGTAVKELVDAFQSQTAHTKNVATIEDMQNFVEKFSEFSAAQRNAGKHVTLMSELSRLVDARILMQARRPPASEAHLKLLLHRPVGRCRRMCVVRSGVQCGAGCSVQCWDPRRSL